MLDLIVRKLDFRRQSIHEPHVMFERFLEYARRIRHVLDAWLILGLCPALALIPWIGLPLGGLCALGGMAASFRVMKEGRFLHGLILGGLFTLTLLALPFYQMAGRTPSLSGGAPIQQPPLPAMMSSRPPPQEPLFIPPRPLPKAAPEKQASTRALVVGSSRVDLQACKLEYSIVSPK